MCYEWWDHKDIWLLQISLIWSSQGASVHLKVYFCTIIEQRTNYLWLLKLLRYLFLGQHQILRCQENYLLQGETFEIYHYRYKSKRKGRACRGFCLPHTLPNLALPSAIFRSHLIFQLPVTFMDLIALMRFNFFLILSVLQNIFMYISQLSISNMLLISKVTLYFYVNYSW